MQFITRKNQLDYLIELIEKGNTGTSKDLALRIHVSVSTLKRMLNELRDLGLMIGYCTQRKTYYIINDTKKYFKN